MTTPRRRTRGSPRLRTAMVALITLVAAGAAGPAEAAGGAVPDGGPMIFSGNGSVEASVVLDALGDHVHLGVCSGHDPVSMFDSFTAYLVEVPTPLLGGNVECGKRVSVTNSSGTTVTATIVGSCDSCSGGDLGLSPVLYARLITMAQHDTSIPVTWRFID